MEFVLRNFLKCDVSLVFGSLVMNLDFEFTIIIYDNSL